MENPERDLARQIIENTNTNLFLTGRAGTGKTTFLRQIREEVHKRMSEYIHFAIAEKNDNVWIAQRQGRAKNSNDLRPP